jgi:hypothetical protein
MPEIFECLMLQGKAPVDKHDLSRFWSGNPVENLWVDAPSHWAVKGFVSLLYF